MSEKDADGFTERERRVALAVMQLKAEPCCLECGGSCLVVLEKISPEEASDIWTACTVCGNEMVWTATPNHAEMMKRIVILTDHLQGHVVKPYDFIRHVDGSCRGLCGGICPACWRKENVSRTKDKVVSNDDGAESNPDASGDSSSI